MSVNHQTREVVRLRANGQVNVYDIQMQKMIDPEEAEEALGAYAIEPLHQTHSLGRQ